MRKWMLITGVVGAVLLVTTLGVGMVFAHGPYPTSGPGPYNPYKWYGGYGYGFTVIAEALGMTPEELADALAEGKSIAQIAQEKGVDLSQIIDKLMEPQISRMSWLVENGFLTQEQADQWLGLKRQMLELRLSFSWYGRAGLNWGFHRGPRGCRGW